ncbi:MAG: ribonuclease HI family protein [Patescibacteria group bacterium]|mgnify:FL=1
MKNKITIYTDGGARGNPGPAGIGVVINGLPSGKKTFGECIGETTNNEAEYRALIFALKKLKQLIGSEKLKDYVIECYADSELMVEQLNGRYKIKEAGIQKFFIEIWNLKIDLDTKISFHHIERAKNQQADFLVNQILDRETNRLAL